MTDVHYVLCSIVSVRYGTPFCPCCLLLALPSSTLLFGALLSERPKSVATLLQLRLTNSMNIFYMRKPSPMLHVFSTRHQKTPSRHAASFTACGMISTFSFFFLLVVLQLATRVCGEGYLEACEVALGVSNSSASSASSPLSSAAAADISALLDDLDLDLEPVGRVRAADYLTVENVRED